MVSPEFRQTRPQAKAAGEISMVSPEFPESSMVTIVLPGSTSTILILSGGSFRNPANECIKILLVFSSKTANGTGSRNVTSRDGIG